MAKRKGTTGQDGVPRGRAPRRGEGPNIVSNYVGKGGKPRQKPGEEIVKLRHEDWWLHNQRWQQLLDSYEGGDTYRNATYGPDRRGRPLRNLLRHKREYPDQAEFADIQAGYGSFAGSAVELSQAMGIGPFPGQLGADPYATADDDDYELRRARTPVPEFVKEACDIHLGKIYEQEVRREGPQELLDWWEDVNGGGMSARDWFARQFSPHYLTLAAIDVCFDRPVLPPGVELKTRADEQQYNQSMVVVSLIIPQNMVWYKADPVGNYLECLVREFGDPDDPKPGDGEDDSDAVDPGTRDMGQPNTKLAQQVRYRHWTQTTVTLYAHDGDVVEEEREHGYPFIPIKRIVHQSLLRSPMIGKSEYDFVAACQREYYNRDSELILSDILQCTPSLSGPSEYCGTEKTLSVGPGNVLPKHVDVNHGVIGWEYVSPDKSPSRELRENMQWIVDLKDRNACLTKPAGVTGTTGGTVSQSGFSKEIDEHSGNKKLGGIAKSLAWAERQIAEFALMCRLRRPLTDADRAAIKITYPSRFQLKGARAILDELNILVPMLAMEEQVAAMEPETDPSQEGGNPTQGANPVAASVVPKPGPRRFFFPTLLAEKVMAYVRADFEGAPPELFSRIAAEGAAFLQLHDIPEFGTSDDSEFMKGHGSQEQVASQDPLGQSAATLVSNQTPIVT